MFEFNATEDAMSDFKDYSAMMTSIEKSMRKMHDNCLNKKWSQAAEQPGEMILVLVELAEWLKEQEDGQEARMF